GFIQFHRNTLVSIRYLSELRLQGGWVTLTVGTQTLQLNRSDSRQPRKQLLIKHRRALSCRPPATIRGLSLCLAPLPASPPRTWPRSRIPRSHGLARPRAGPAWKPRGDLRRARIDRSSRPDDRSSYEYAPYIDGYAPFSELPGKRVSPGRSRP